ncbi:MAG: WD40/YVTN/BNR-like repeat-containing protein, partial [Planctomycetota bacterium]
MHYSSGSVCVVCLVLAAAVASVTAREPAILYQEDFDDGQAQGWELEAGWSVTEGRLRGQGHWWARPSAGPWEDFRLRARVNVVEGGLHLVYRLNETGRYFIGFNEEGSYLHKQYWPDTFVPGLAGSDVAHARGIWHEIEIVGEGSSLAFKVDGFVEWEYTDLEPLLAGAFAFETLDDSIALVDDIVVLSAAVDAGSAWVRTGGPLGGLGYDVRMRPGDPNVMYVTDAQAGVHMSTDGGRTWFPSNKGIDTRTGASGDLIPVFSLTIDPLNHDIIWAGTQGIRGIFKSTDGGRTWVEKDEGVTEFEGITFRGFAVDPHSSDIVYAAAELSSWVWFGQPSEGREFDMTGGVVYRTVDGGENWTAIWRGENLARYVWIDPRDSNVVYASTGIFDREAANSDPNLGTPGGVGVIKSTDGGQSWTQVNNG